VERLGGLARLHLGATRHRGGIEGLAAERTTGITPGAAARHVEGRGTSPASTASRFAVERLAGLDPGAARHRAGIEGLAADRTTGIGSGAAAREGIERLAPRGGALAGLEGSRGRSRHRQRCRRSGTARRGAWHVASIERLAVERSAGFAGLGCTPTTADLASRLDAAVVAP
jgi:hypothetical protein